MKTKQVAVVVSALLILLVFASFINAETQTINGKEYEVTASSSFSLADWFKHTFNIQSFSVVGDTRQCGQGGYADLTMAVSGGDTFDGYASQECSSGSGIWDVYIGNSWVPWREFKDNVVVICNSANTQCNFELYCCPHPEPTSDVQCRDWYGTNSVKKTVTGVPWNGGYKFTINGVQENNIPYNLDTVSYCTQNVAVDCWYYSGSGTSCSKRTYSGETACPYDYQSQRLYSSQSQCTSTIPTQCTPSTACAANTCAGETCSNGCGGLVQGTKNCGGVTCNADQVNINGVCKLKSEICTEQGGTKYCSASQVDDPALDGITIMSLTYGDATGGVLTGPVKQGDQIRVDFKVKIDNPSFFSGSKEYLIETGLVPGDVAMDWFGKPSGQNYAIFDPFSVYDTSKSVCCKGQENINSLKLKVAYQPSDLGNWIIDQVTDRDSSGAIIYSGHVLITAPSSNTQDLCPVNNNPTSYWNPDSSEYALYLVVKNDCLYKEAEYTGYQKAKWLIKDVTLDVNGTLGDGAGGGQKCSVDSECASGQCIDAPGWFTGNICSSSTSGVTGGNSLIDTKKISLSRESISSSTSSQLLASVCLKDSECVLKESESENNEARCISIAKLRDDGDLTKDDSTNLFANSKNLGYGVVTGAVGGVLFCTVPASAALIGLTGGAGTLAVPAVAGTCAAVGALIGGTVTSATIDISQNDALLRELKAENENAVGICTIESTTFGGAEFIKKLGRSFNITGNESTDGLIVLGFGFVILFFLVSALGGKK